MNKTTVVVFEDRTMTLTAFWDHLYLHIEDPHARPYSRCILDLVPRDIRSENAIIVLKDMESNVKELHSKSYEGLPSDEAIRKREGIPPGIMPVIYYQYTSSTCIFGAECTICRVLIDNAYVGVQRDKDKDTYEGGLSFQEALKKEYATLAAWTDEEWLLCKWCIKRAHGRYRIVRPFRFEGDIPYGRSKLSYKTSFDNTTERTFRKTPVVELE